MDDIDLLIEMGDSEVRKQVGEYFRAQLRSHPAVAGTFFPGATVPNPAPPPDLMDFVGDIASALVGWALSVTAAYGFNNTADGKKAMSYVTDALNWGSNEYASVSISGAGTQEEKERTLREYAERAKVIENQGKFKKLASFNYDALFPQYCAKGSTTFQRYLNDKPETWGGTLADVLASDNFIVKTALLRTADPTNFYQGLYLQLYKVYRLAPSRLESVLSAWNRAKLVDLAPPRPSGYRFVPPIEKLTVSWTNYEWMQASNFSEQTFLSDIQNAVGSRTTTGRVWHSYPMSSHSATSYGYYTDEYTFGKGVAEWLSQRRGKYEFLTSAEPSNKVTE